MEFSILTVLIFVVIVINNLTLKTEWLIIINKDGGFHVVHLK